MSTYFEGKGLGFDPPNQVSLGYLIVGECNNQLHFKLPLNLTVVANGRDPAANIGHYMSRYAHRYVNIARGDKLLLKTGHEPLLGVQQADKVGDSKVIDRNLAREDTSKQRDDYSLNTSVVSGEVFIRPGKGDATDRTQDVSSVAQHQSAASREIFVFRKEDEAQADKE
jgi:hypothetical protein